MTGVIAPPPGLGELLRVSLKIGLLSFGGPAGQIAMMHRVFVDEKRWLEEKDYLSALSFCMLLPGPEAMQLATYAGWRLRGIPGGLIAGLLFVLPGAVLMLGLAMAYARFGAVGPVAAAFLGVKAAVVAIVIEALMKVARRALGRRDHWLLAGLAFAAIFFLNLPFPALVLAAALYGFFSGGSAVGAAPAPTGRPRTAATALGWLAIWWLPLLLLWLLVPGSVLIGIGLFFAKLAVVTFGGAYAVLAYMAQQAVTVEGWLSAEQMIDGLGLAETTPGPLILVTEFVGFLAAYGAGGMWLGIAGAGVALWMTFAPCFLWIFTGAPYIARLSAQPRLKNALAAVTAAVVGVILNLTLWFALHVLFTEVTRLTLGPVILWWPDPASADPFAIALAGLAAYLLLWRHWGMLPVLALSGMLGLLAMLV
ncbi:MAG: chromate efflux transporter [Rhodobacteraceae bacterium]|nr:chromate efflux transporter [Paracoccaceae bacterium]